MDLYQLSIEDLKMLVTCERQMDRGEIPYVRLDGCSQRMAMDPGDMADLGLEVGQTITPFIATEIAKMRVRKLTEQIEYEKLVREIEATEKS